MHLYYSQRFSLCFHSINEQVRLKKTDLIKNRNTDFKLLHVCGWHSAKKFIRAFLMFNVDGLHMECQQQMLHSINK